MPKIDEQAVQHWDKYGRMPPGPDPRQLDPDKARCVDTSILILLIIDHVFRLQRGAVQPGSPLFLGWCEELNARIPPRGPKTETPPSEDSGVADQA